MVHDKGHQRQFHLIIYGKNSVFVFLVYVDRQVLHVKLHPFFQFSKFISLVLQSFKEYAKQWRISISRAKKI